MAKSKNNTPKSYNEAIAELDEIKNWLEENPTDFDQMISKVRRAKELYEYCQNQLLAGEQQLRDVFEEE